MTDSQSFHLRELPSPFVQRSGVLRLMEPATTCPAELYRRILDGTYDKPYIVEDGQLRELCFGAGDTQSAMRMCDPYALCLAYTRAMMAFLLFNSQPRRIALLGLGGGSIAKYCYRYLPGSRITAVESDRNVLALRDEFLIPHDDFRFSVIEGDGAAYIAGLHRRVDVLLVDAFDCHGIPLSLTDLEFYGNARRCLSPEGMFVMNLAGDRDEYLPHLEWIYRVFGDAVIAFPVDDGSNWVIFAQRQMLVEPQWKWLLSYAKRLEALFGLSFLEYVRELKRWYRVPPGARKGAGFVARPKGTAA